MGGSASTMAYSNEEAIRTEMVELDEKWKKVVEGREYYDQSSFFKENIPKEVTNLTTMFNETGLNTVFTHSRKVVLDPGSGTYNSAMLYRSSQEDPDIPIFDTGDHLVLHPLGEPGRDLGNSDNRITHLMIVPTGESVPLCLNEMLPGTQVEVNDLEKRIETLKQAYTNMKNNVPLSACGKKVVDKADSLGVSHETGIRDFMGTMIMSLTPEFKAGRPGYKLKDKDGTEYSGDESKLRSYINTHFSNTNLKCSIQPPWENSQFLSHIHGFIVDTPIGDLPEMYRDIEIILKVKKERITDLDVSEAEEEEPLTRTVTNGGGLSRTMTTGVR